MSGMIYGNTKASNLAVLMARVTGDDGEALQQADVSAAVYTVYLLGETDHTQEAAVANHTAVVVAVASLIYDTPQTNDDDAAWTVDDTGYNFKHTPSNAVAEPFALEGRTYKVVYSLTVSGDTLSVEFRVTTHRTAAVTGYCTRQDIEDIFGADNVSKWADIQNNGNGDHIAGRIGQAILWTTAEVNDRLREGPVELPIVTVPRTIVDLAAHFAGVWLYESRGVEDFDPDTGAAQHKLQFHRKHVEKTLSEIRAGKRRLSITASGKGMHVPMVVKR